MSLAPKIFGWVLLAAGVLIISWTLLSSYNIFTGKAEAPAIFEVEEEETLTPVEPAIPASLEEPQKEMEKMFGEQLKEMLPVDTLPKLLNLAVWAMLAWILIFGGAHLSGLGIKLINPVRKS